MHTAGYLAAAIGIAHNRDPELGVADSDVGRTDHAENAGGMIDEVLDQRLWIGCFPWKFMSGEAAFCRLVAFVGQG